MKPTVGRIVQFDQEPVGGMAALVTGTHDSYNEGVQPSSPMHVHLLVFPCGGQPMVRMDVPFEGSGQQRWYWPVREEL